MSRGSTKMSPYLVFAIAWIVVGAAGFAAIGVAINQEAARWAKNPAGVWEAVNKDGTVIATVPGRAFDGPQPVQLFHGMGGQRSEYVVASRFKHFENSASIAAAKENAPRCH